LTGVGEGRDGLTVDGEVERPLQFDGRTALVADLLEQAAPRPAADHATVHAAMDGYTASIPLTDLRRGTLADGRLVVEGGRTLCWNVKDVVRIEVTVGHQPDSVPERPQH
jgi:DMSO/TMAO reductase YedYZ molybdopterin-dependent catalytic subunit